MPYYHMVRRLLILPLLFPTERDSTVISVSLFDGNVIEVPCGVSVKISEDLNKRIRDEILLPASVRRMSMINGGILPYERKGNLYTERLDSNLSNKHDCQTIMMKKQASGSEQHIDRVSKTADPLRSKIGKIKFFCMLITV